MEPETARTIFWLLLLPFLAICYYDYRNEKRLISEGYFKKRRRSIVEAHKQNMILRRQMATGQITLEEATKILSDKVHAKL